MFELEFGGERLEAISAWLDANREGLSVLVHPLTEDEPRDHTEGARWLGPRLGLDLSKLPLPNP
jgi:DOPA 4,5-dioxygenase